MTDTVDTDQTQFSETVDTVPDTVGTGRNTNNRARAWFMTWNSYPEDWQTQLTQLTQEFKGQVEMGASGNRHIQAVFRFANPRTFDQVKRMFPGAHLEVCHNWRAAQQYCTKEETRVSDIIDYFTEYHCVTLRYQAKILDFIEKDPDMRAINWFWSEAGNVGKSTFCRHLALKYNAIVVNGAGKDVFHAICEANPKPSIIIFDLPRGASIDYTVLESIKNGLFFSTKYESKMCVFNIPHVIVFANIPPRYEALSPDRWVVCDIPNME